MWKKEYVGYITSKQQKQTREMKEMTSENQSTC